MYSISLVIYGFCLLAKFCIKNDLYIALLPETDKESKKQLVLGLCFESTNRKSFVWFNAKNQQIKRLGSWFFDSDQWIKKLFSHLFGSRQRFITRISWIIFRNRYNKWIKWFETVFSLPSSDSKSTVNSENFPLVPIYNDNCSASSDSASTSAVLHFWTDWILRWNLRRAIRSRVNSLSAFLFCWLNSIFQCFCCTGFKIYRKC